MLPRFEELRRSVKCWPAAGKRSRSHGSRWTSSSTVATRWSSSGEAEASAASDVCRWTGWRPTSTRSETAGSARCGSSGPEPRPSRPWGRRSRGCLGVHGGYRVAGHQSMPREHLLEVVDEAVDAFGGDRALVLLRSQVLGRGANLDHCARDLLGGLLLLIGGADALV